MLNNLSMIRHARMIAENGENSFELSINKVNAHIVSLTSYRQMFKETGFFGVVVW